jgi:hypothetical protein
MNNTSLSPLSFIMKMETACSYCNINPFLPDYHIPAAFTFLAAAVIAIFNNNND